MTIIPIQKLPVLIAYNCIAKVNPQGKKKVNIPLPNVHKYFFHQRFFSFSISVSPTLNRFPVGKEREKVLSFGESWLKFTPRSNITIPTIKIITDIIKGERLITCQSIPNIPHKKVNPTILPALNQK
jgi:hypothetical protein